MTAECGEWCAGLLGGTEAELSQINLWLQPRLVVPRLCLISCSLAAGTFPIDLTKTRLQVQGQVGDSKYREIRYRGMLHAMGRIVREEGLLALYSGSVWRIVCVCVVSTPRHGVKYLSTGPIVVLQSPLCFTLPSNVITSAFASPLSHPHLFQQHKVGIWDTWGGLVSCLFLSGFYRGIKSWHVLH